MSNPVIITVPISGFNLQKNPPDDDQNTTENIDILGSDYTTITIPAGVKYNNNASTNYQVKFTGPTNASKEFIIEFPANTYHETKTSGRYKDVFVTPSKVYYSFEETVIYEVLSSKTKVSVNTGRIDITTSQNTSNVNENNDYTPESLDRMLKDKAIAAGNEVSENIEKVIYENFNQNFLTLLYTLLKDFIVVISVWLIVINIGLWGTVDPELVHPIDVTKYPYTFNDGETINNLTSFTPTDAGVFCGKLGQNEIGKISTDLRDKLQKNPELKEKLEFMNPTMSEISAKNIYYSTKIIHSYCSTTGSYSNALSVLMYWLSYLIFTQGIYQNYILNGFHKVLNSIIKNVSILFTSENYYSSILLSLLIYGIIKAIEPTVESIKNPNKRDLSGNYIGKYENINYVEKPENIFIYGLINVFSILLLIAIPSFFLLFFVGLLGHIQSILRIIFESNSVECAFLSVIALTATVVTFFQLFRYMIDRGSRLITLKALEEQIIKNLNFSSLFTIISNGAGVGIPLAIAIVSAVVVTFRILMTTIYVIKEKIELLKNLSPAVMILLFYFLIKNVYVILGPVESYITIAVIAFYGFYFITKK